MKVSLKDATIKLKGGGTGEEITLKIGDGAVTWTEYNNRDYTLDRGTLDEVRDGDEQPMDVNMDFNWEWLEAYGTGTPPTPREVLQDLAGWTSTDSDQCRPPSIDVEITIEKTCGATTETEVILLPYYRNDQLDYDIDAGQISGPGKCNATKATVVHTST